RRGRRTGVLAQPVAGAAGLVRVRGARAPVAGAAAAAVGGDGDQTARRHGGAAERAAFGTLGPVGRLPDTRPLVRRGAGRRGDATAVAGGVRACIRAAPHSPPPNRGPRA